MTPANPDALADALAKINGIRNSIIGLQTMDWSEHIYPLAAALNAAGFEGMSYPDARKNFGTMLERTNAAEDALATAEARAAQLQAEVEALKAKLTEAAEAADAPWSGYGTYQTSIDNEEAHNLRRCREIVRAARTALAARAATAREG